METVASAWACDPSDPCDLVGFRERRHEPSRAWGTECVFSSAPPAGWVWMEQQSSHLQRNKQLQDTLLQREEELTRLQEENNKLREFLTSSFVRNLEEKAKKLSSDGRKKLKRNLTTAEDGSFQTCSQQLRASPQVSKRVCRNLTAEFCSKTSSTSEPNLDLWVLRTLGLKDRDTIDMSSNSSLGFPLRSLVSDTAPPTRSSLDCSSFSAAGAASPSSAAHSFCQSSAQQMEYGYSATAGQEHEPALLDSDSKCASCPGQCLNFTAAGPTRACDASEAMMPPVTARHFTQSPGPAAACSSGTTGRSPTLLSAYWALRTPSQDSAQLNPTGVHSSHITGPTKNQPRTPVQNLSPTSLSAPQTPRGRTELAFSMSLSPSSSVKTHSFPQGQAFIRKDAEGRWNFTWVPRHGQ